MTTNTADPATTHTPAWVAAILEARPTFFAARVLLTCYFWGSGIVHITGWTATNAFMEQLGLSPGYAFNTAAVMVHFIGSALVIWGPYAWLGAGILGVFTALTIPIARAFWTMPQPEATIQLFAAMEHVGMIGGLIIVAIARHRGFATRS